MIRRLLDLIYGYSSVPAQFQSAFGLDESVRRLASATERPGLLPRMHQAAVGSVSRDRVSLYRTIPLFRNSFKPRFLGSFRDAGGRVVLDGQFTVHWSVKVFMTSWFGFCFPWTLMAVPAALSVPRDLWWFPLAGLGMIAMGLALVALCKRMARGDIPWLSRVIQDALLARAG